MPATSQAGTPDFAGRGGTGRGGTGRAATGRGWAGAGVRIGAAAPPPWIPIVKSPGPRTRGAGGGNGRAGGVAKTSVALPGEALMPAAGGV